MAQQIIFYVFAGITILASTMMILSKNPVRAVLLLVLAFVGASGTWMVLEIEFLAVALILVYVGAVMVLFLFVVMMLDIDFATLRSSFSKFLPIGLLVPILLLGLIIFGVGKDGFSDKIATNLTLYSADHSNISYIALELFTNYIYHFEIAGILLLAAMVAAIGITFRGTKNRRGQVVTEQIMVDSKSRVKLVNPTIDEEA